MPWSEVELSIGIPSITNNGLVLRESELIPLIRILAPWPGPPPQLVIVTPATLPCNAFNKLL